MEGFSLPHTPLGPLWVLLTAGCATQLGWGQTPPQFQPVSSPLQMALQSYFKGEGLKVPPASIAPKGTAFQQQVWAELLNIPHGQTRTYQQLANTLGSHPRAVGTAVGANPLPILIPCHRVLGSNGSLTGFSAPGGIASKKILLQLEGALSAELPL